MQMNSMFSNFTNLETTYQPNAFQPSYPFASKQDKIQSVNINKPYELLNADGTLKGYFWYKGNSVDLVFNLEGEITLLAQDQYLTASDIINQLQLVANIYNFRMEPVLQFSNSIDAKNKLIVEI